MQGIKEWDERSLSPVPSQQRPVIDAEAEEGRKDVLPVDEDFKGHSSSSNEESVVERSLPERNEKLEKEKADMVAEIALLLQKLEQIVEESGREREVHENEISYLKGQVMEKVEAVSARDAQLEELEVAKALSEQELRTALDRTEKDKEQLLQECMDVKSQVGRLAEERDKFLRSIDVYEKDLEVLRADSTKLAVQVGFADWKFSGLAKSYVFSMAQRVKIMTIFCQILVIILVSKLVKTYDLPVSFAINR